MAQLTFTQDNLPTPEKFRQLLLEAMVASNPIDELLELAEELGEYERRYELSSEKLYKRYQRGEMGDEREIMDTVDRSGLWAAQTPQLFRVEALAEAIDAAHLAGCELTDEASAMEFVGARPKLVMGSVSNIKITHPADLAIAEALLARKERPS